MKDTRGREKDERWTRKMQDKRRRWKENGELGRNGGETREEEGVN
jgi:hypothetical protein